ncbi:phage tail spike protein [Oceanobacillus sp. FSL K6-0251]|uniref:phage tail spike protein n=1 Tax=Oceanobacillus sp. FSL K6-0251 TaxID=2921602 RepID=UPI0030F9D0D8
MYPILYKSNETNFVHNGIGFLRDAITVYPEEELNGYSEITIEYDADGFLADEIKNGMIIKSKANDKQQPQLFRIYSHVKDHSADQIIINGRHITNDLADNFVEALEIRNMTTYQAMKAIQERLAYPTRFNFSSTNTTTTSSTNIYRNNPLQMVAGTEGSILQHWGGQIERDNFDLIMHRRRGSDDGVKVLYKKNLTGLQATFDDDSVVTRIYPFKYVEETEEERARLITVPGKYIDSPNIDKYPHIKILPIDASSEEGIENSTDLYNAYKDYFSNEGKDKDLPSVSMEVEFEHLHETEEYKDVAALEHVGLGDTITVGHTKWGLDLKASIVKIEYDAIAEKNRKVSAGNVRANFTDSVNQNENDLGVIGDRMNNIDQKSNEAIRAANGKNTIYYGPDEPIGDNLIKGDIWFRIVDGEYTRTYIYDGVQWQLSIDMESKEAKETAAEAHNRAEEAVGKADLATSNAIEAINQAQEAFDNAENLSKVVDENTEDISEISQIAQGLQTKVSNAEGDISTVTQLATALQSRMTNAEGSISTLTQTATSLQSTIKGVRDDLDDLQIGAKNYISHEENNWEAGSYWSATGNLNNTSGRIRTPKKSIESNTVYTMTDYSTYDDRVIFYLYLWNADGSFSRSMFVDTNSLTMTFTTRENETEYAVAVWNDGETVIVSDLGNKAKVQLERGNKSTDWSLSPDDMATQSQISQLSDNINLRVQKNDIINQINISTEDILISGKKLILDGDTTVNGSFRVENANITSLNAGKITGGTFDGGKVNVINVSANSIVGGILQSQNSNTTFNMNSGLLTMRNVNFVLGNGAMIEFTNVSNRIQYSDTEGGVTRSSGFGVGKSLSGFPFSYSGTTGASNLDTLSPYWSGAIWNTTRAITDGASNSISGFRFQFRAQAVDWDRGLEIDFNGSPSITPINGASYNYDLGNNDRMFNDLYIRRLRSVQSFDVRNVASINKGWLFETSESGGTMSIRGLNGGSYTYVLGDTESYNHFSYGYITNLRAPSSGNSSVGLSSRPYTFGHFDSFNVYGNLYAQKVTETSDRRKKKNIKNTKLGLAFINQLNPVDYEMIDSSTTRTGFIAQEMSDTLNKYHYTNQEIVSQDGQGYLGISYTQLIAPLARGLQELDTKVDSKVKNLEEIIEKQALKIADLEQRIHNLEVA